MPVEIDLSRVRREREVGIRGLGQTLKSFRDRPIEFPVYQKHLGRTDYLDSLGPLIKPSRGSRSDRALPPERATAAGAGCIAGLGGIAGDAGTTLEALTDPIGSFRLANIPAGPARLRVSFTGLPARVEAVTIRAGIPFSATLRRARSA